MVLTNPIQYHFNPRHVKKKDIKEMNNESPGCKQNDSNEQCKENSMIVNFMHNLFWETMTIQKKKKPFSQSIHTN